MRTVLHLIKDPGSRMAFETIARQAADPSLSVTIVLLQAAANLREPLAGQVFRLDENGDRPMPPSPHPRITHSHLLDLIFAADTVVAW